MPHFKLTRVQVIMLAALALGNLLLVGGMSAVVIHDLLSPSGPTPIPLTLARGDAAPPTPLPLPTWTPVPTPTPQGLELLYVFTPGVCPFEIPDGAMIECGVVGVPETRGEVPAGVVQLAVARYRSTASDPGDPLVYLTGGPGGDAVAASVNLYDVFMYPILAERDIIIFDQRGTGRSKPFLECPEFHSVTEMDLQWNYSVERLAAAYMDAATRCRTRWEIRGVNLAAYTSAENAADVKDLITTLGYERATLYGASYGSRLALTVMRDYPAVVRSAILDGVVPLEVHLFNDQSARMDRLLRQLFVGCAANAACRTAYPNLESVYQSAIARHDAQPATVWSKRIGHKSYRVLVNGDWITGAIFFGAYDTELIRYLPMMLHDVSRGDYELLAWMLGNVGQKTDLSTGMYLSVNCHEEVFATTPAQLAADLAAYPHTESFANWSIYGTSETLFVLCETWHAAPFDPREAEPVLSDIPTLLLSGEYDPITPPAYGRMVAANLSASQHYEFPGQGHVVGLWQSSCAVRIARDFISDPYAALDTACIQRTTGPDFITR